MPPGIHTREFTYLILVFFILAQQLDDTFDEALGYIPILQSMIKHQCHQKTKDRRLPQVHLLGKTIYPWSLISVYLFQRFPDFRLGNLPCTFPPLQDDRSRLKRCELSKTVQTPWWTAPENKNVKLQMPSFTCCPPSNMTHGIYRSDALHNSSCRSSAGIFITSEDIRVKRTLTTRTWSFLISNEANSVLATATSPLSPDFTASSGMIRLPFALLIFLDWADG